MALAAAAFAVLPVFVDAVSKRRVEDEDEDVVGLGGRVAELVSEDDGRVAARGTRVGGVAKRGVGALRSVSYTHLTLPTKA